MIVTVGLLIWLLLNLFAVVVISRKNVSFGLLPNLTLATFIVLYVIPIFFDRHISDEVLFAVVIANAILIAIFVSYSISKGNYLNRIREAEERKRLSISGFSVLLAIIFCVIGNVATYYSLINSGGLFSVIFDFGGRGYLSARVNGEGSGMLGVLAWLSPFSLAFLFAAALSKRRKRYWILFLIFFFMTALGYGLLTVRHNMIATLIMLMLTYLTFRKASFKIVILFFATSIAVLVYFQSLRVSGIQGLAFDMALNSAFASNEHLRVTEHIIKQTNATEFTVFTHVSDVFIFAIPRSIWPSKPETSTLNRIFFPEVASVGSEKAIGLIAEGYASLGLLGVSMITAAFAFMISRFQRHLNRTWSEPKAAFIAVAFVPICYIGVRTGFLGKHLISFMLIYTQYLILMRASRYRLVFNSSHLQTVER